MSQTISTSVPLEEGEIAETMTLQEYANKFAGELHRVKAIIHLPQISCDEIGARIEEVKISMAMNKQLFEILVNEHTKRMNKSLTPIDELDPEIESIIGNMGTQCSVNKPDCSGSLKADDCKYAPPENMDIHANMDIPAARKGCKYTPCYCECDGDNL